MEGMGNTVQCTLDVNLDNLITTDNECMLRLCKVSGSSGPERNDLEESRNGRRDVLDAIDKPLIRV